MIFTVEIQRLYSFHITPKNVLIFKSGMYNFTYDSNLTFSFLFSLIASFYLVLFLVSVIIVFILSCFYQFENSYMIG